MFSAVTSITVIFLNPHKLELLVYHKLGTKNPMLYFSDVVVGMNVNRFDIQFLD